MRYLFLGILLLSLVAIPTAGCGGGKPDPRDNPDFVDDPNPDLATQGLDADTGPNAAKQ